MKILFWLLAAIDAAVLGLMLVLGLAAAVPSRTNPLSVLAFMLVPALVLVAAIAVFTLSQTKVARIAAFLLVASPVLIAVFGRAQGELLMRSYTDDKGELSYFRAGTLRELEAAILEGDAATVTRLAKAAPLNTVGRAGMTPLLLALEKKPDLVPMLLAAGADPNLGEQELPLVVAIAASRKRGPELTRLLLEKGAKPNARSEFGDPAWFMAASAQIDLEVLRLVLDHGADIHIKGNNGCNAVATAVLTRNWPAARLLIERGAEWRDRKMPTGLPVKEWIENDARTVGDAPGLAELLKLIR